MILWFYKALLQHCSWFFPKQEQKVAAAYWVVQIRKNLTSLDRGYTVALHTCLRRIQPQEKSILKASMEEQDSKRYKGRAILVTWAIQRSRISLAVHAIPKKNKYNIIKVLWKTSFCWSWQLTSKRKKEMYCLVVYF